MFINRKWINQTVVYLYNGILDDNKKEQRTEKNLKIHEREGKVDIIFPIPLSKYN